MQTITEIRDELSAQCKRDSEALQSFPRTAFGLTPDSVKASPEWKSANQAFRLSFERLRRVNRLIAKSRSAR